MAASLEVLREPATLIQDPAGTPLYFHFKAGSTLKVVQDRFDVQHDGRVIDNRLSDQVIEFSGRPVGEFENLAVLFPHMGADLGSRIIGATDVAWQLITASGRSWTFHRAALTKRPGLMAKTGDTLLGELTLTAVYSSTEAATFTYATGQTHPGFASLANASILTLAPAVSFGADPFDNVFPVDGAEFDFAWELTPVLSNRRVIDWTIASQEATAVCKPQSDATWGELMTKIGADIAMGASPPVASFIATYSGFYAALFNAQAQIEEFAFSHDANFVSGISARAMQRYTAGVADDLFYVGTAAPA